MSSKLILYFAPGSPPARACLLLARYLELDIEVKNVNLVAGEQHGEEFAKLNPQKKVPVLVDGDFVVSESRAILAYLVNSRKPGSSLYPVDPKQRAVIDQQLYYDATVVFPGLASIVVRLVGVEKLSVISVSTSFSVH
jgi:glutathione S-transferase